MTQSAEARRIEAVAKLYHAWITGLVLSLVARKGADIAEDFVFRLFRQQHHEKFLPGLEKLGLVDEADAVACAKYHYFSNQLGGVSVEYLEESPNKAWIRYPPPRWIWYGTAICGIPSNVNRAMLYGWHAHNGVTLGNPRLGFVCTGTTVDGHPGLEGFYREYDDEIPPEKRLLFRPELDCPMIDPASLPTLDAASWPEERKARAYRNYAMEYLRNALPVLVAQLGPEEARYVGRICALQTGMHQYHDLAADFAVNDPSAESFVDLLAQVLETSGDTLNREGGRDLTRSRWRIFPDPPHEVVEDTQVALFEGLLASHNRSLGLKRERIHGSLCLHIN